MRASCPGGLTAQIKGEKLMVVASTADGFRAAVGALRSLTEECCVRLLLNNLGRGMLESIVREELQSLNFRVQVVTQWPCGRRDQNPAKERLTTPTSLYQRREGLKRLRCDHSPKSAACEYRWNRTCLQKSRCNISATSATATCSVTGDTHSGASLV